MDISFKWVGGATVVLTIEGLKIAVDPVLCKVGTIQDYFWFKSKRLENPVFLESDFSDVDIWLITHNHEDHLDEFGMSVIEQASKVVANVNGARKLMHYRKDNVSSLAWHAIQKYSIKGFEVEITAIPAIHGVNPLSAYLAGKGNGYYVCIRKEEQKFCFYFTGDTVYNKRLVKAMGGKPIDLLVPNMGAAKQGSWIMTLTLNARMLAKLIQRLVPKKVIPVHYGTFEHYSEPGVSIDELGNPRIKMLSVGESCKIT